MTDDIFNKPLSLMDLVKFKVEREQASTERKQAKRDIANRDSTERKQANRDSKIDTPERMLELGRQLVTAHALICDASTINVGRGTQVYQLNLAQNTIKAISDNELEALVFLAEPRYVQRCRIEVISFIRQTVSTEQALDFSNVAAVAFDDQMDVTCFKRFGFTRSAASLIKLDNLPGFAHILALCDDSRSLVLWLGSLLDWKSARTQYLHWHGGGGNGKSTVFQAISDALGHERVVHTRMSDFNSPHWGAEIVGARLLLFPDVNNTHIFSSGKFKELTGEEHITINPKNMPYRKIKLMNKTAILSNKNVAITNGEADKRRLLPICSSPDTETDHGNKSWYHDVRSNGERILLYCYSEYEKELVLNPGIRAYIEPLAAAIDDAVEERYGYWLAIIEDTIEVRLDDPLKPKVGAVDLYNRLGEVRGNSSLSQREREDVKEALQTIGIERSRSTDGRRVYKGCKLKAGV